MGAVTQKACSARSFCNFQMHRCSINLTHCYFGCTMLVIQNRVQRYTHLSFDSEPQWVFAIRNVTCYPLTNSPIISFKDPWSESENVNYSYMQGFMGDDLQTDRLCHHRLLCL